MAKIDPRLTLKSTTESAKKAKFKGDLMVVHQHGGGNNSEIGDTDNVVLSHDWLAIGTSVGAYADGTVIPAGTNLTEFLDGMGSKVIHPVYTEPTVSLTGTGEKSVEVGTKYQMTLTTLFTKNDGGEATDFELKQNGVAVESGLPISEYTAPVALTIGEIGYSFVATVSFGDGPIKNNNMGIPDPTGRIMAGSRSSSTITYVGQRNMFCGTNANMPSSFVSSEIRALSNKILNPINGTNFSIEVTNSDKQLVVAYPDTLRDLTVAKQRSTNLSVLGSLTKLLVEVEGANGYTPANYKVFYLNAPVGFNPENYDFTI